MMWNTNVFQIISLTIRQIGKTIGLITIKKPLFMKFKSFFLFAWLLSTIYLSDVYAQFSQADREARAKLTKADFVQMLEQLGLEESDLRPRPSGNPTAPNAAISLESKVNPYDLPDPLVLENGVKISDADDWWEKRRPEIVESFEREVYGRLPENIPIVSWKIKSSHDTLVGNFPIKEKILRGVVDNSSFPDISVEIELLVATPLSATLAVPLVMEFGFINSPFNPSPVEPI